MQNETESYSEANVYKASDNDWIGMEMLFIWSG